MERNLAILIIFILIVMALIIFLIAKNRNDKKNLFKKVPGDYPDPKEVKSEFDKEE